LEKEIDGVVDRFVSKGWIILKEEKHFSLFV